MRLRQKKYKDYFNLLRNRPKYKILGQIGKHIFESPKMFKLKHQKWRFLIASKYRRFKKRIFLQPSAERVKNLISAYEPIYHPRYSYRFKALLNIKRYFKLWYRIKRKKNLGQFYFQSLYQINAEKKKQLKISKILSFFNHFERRIDVILFRIFFLPSIYYAQKLIQQGYISVNNKIITYFNMIHKLNETIEIVKSRSFFVQQIKSLSLSLYKPKLLLLINYLHLEINYNILIIKSIQPFMYLKDIRCLFPFNFNFKVMQQYFYKHH